MQKSRNIQAQVGRGDLRNVESDPGSQPWPVTHGAQGAEVRYRPENSMNTGHKSRSHTMDASNYPTTRTPVKADVSWHHLFNLLNKPQQGNIFGELYNCKNIIL